MSFLIFQTSKRYDFDSVWACVSHAATCHDNHQVGFAQRHLLFCLIMHLNKSFNYGAQNEAYMSRSAEKWVRGLCFNELGVCGLNDGVKRSVYIGLHLVYFWGLLRLLWFTWGLRVVYIAFLLVVGVVLGWGRMVAEATFFYGVSEFLYCEIIPYNDYLVYLQKQNE